MKIIIEISSDTGTSRSMGEDAITMEASASKSEFGKVKKWMDLISEGI